MPASGETPCSSSKAGLVQKIDARGVWLGVEATKPLQAVLITGPIFGNALRDSTGLLSLSDFTSIRFQPLGAELNRLADARSATTAART